MQEITWKCYSPLRADFFPQEVYDDPYLMDREGPMELDGGSLVEYAESICDAIQRENEAAGDLAPYIHGDRAAVLNGKVLSILPSVEIVDDELMGCAVVTLREPLNGPQTAALREYLTGQYSDGWGESFEQQEIEVSEGTLYVHFWSRERFNIEIDRHPDGALQQEQQPATPVRPKMNLVGEDGNIFAILGRAARLLHRFGQEDRAKEMTQRVTASSSYNDALFIVSEYVETELSAPGQQRQAKTEKQKGGDAR